MFTYIRYYQVLDFLVFVFAVTALAQDNLPIYTNHLVNGFTVRSPAQVDLFNNFVVHSGSNSISICAKPGQELSFFNNHRFNTYHGGLDASLYSALTFWANGGSGGGQRLEIYAQFGANNVAGPIVSLTGFPKPTLIPNTWIQLSVPICALEPPGMSNLNRINIRMTPKGTTNLFYMDDIQIVAAPVPTMVHIKVNAGQIIRPVEALWFGMNTGIGDRYFDTPQTLSLLREMGTQVLRYPGGSHSDEYHWESDTTLKKTAPWPLPFSKFVQVATNIGAQAFITVNYGTGTPAEAAAWVRCANITNHLDYKYWEIGNELYGTWETDTNVNLHDPYTYAVRVWQYIRQMKEADPTIKVGVVVVGGEDSYSNNYPHDHPATNLLNGTVHYGWTPVLMSTLRRLHVMPDFAAFHHYPEFTTKGAINISESDPLLLQCSTTWADEAVELRSMITNYFGSAGTNIELVVTENNGDSGPQGQQSTSLVTALYYADSLGQLMQTEFNAFCWWRLRNGTDHSGEFDPTLYGWRNIGDHGVVSGLTNCYPAFYAAKMMHYFMRPGDDVVSASTDLPLVSVYAVRGADGSLSLLIINKSFTADFNALISLAGFVPQPNAMVYTYGIPQDNAARTGIGSPDIAMTHLTGAGTNLNYKTAPLSLSVITLTPSLPPK